MASDQVSGRRASRIPVYGVDERFWRFHGMPAALVEEGSAREALVSAALAARIGVSAGSALLVRVERPSAVPIESLHGRKEDVGRTMRLTVRAVAGASALGEFSLRPQQSRVQAVFVPLKRLQQEMGLEARVNTLLVSEKSSKAAGDRPGRTALEALLRRRAALEDVGLTVRAVEPAHALAVESSAGVLDQAHAAAADRAAQSTSMRAQPIFTYLVNTMRAGTREIPYSLVTAMDLRDLAVDATSQTPAPGSPPSIVLNEWAARDLGARTGDPLALDYYVWEDPG